MTASWVDLINQSNGIMQQVALVFPRVAAVMAFLPALGERSIPGRVKLGLALCLAAILTPMLGDRLIPPTVPSEWLVLIVVEAGVGTLLAMMIRLWVPALQTAGAIAAQATSLSQLFGGAVADPLPALGNVLLLAGLTLFVMSGLHLRVIEFLHASFTLFPLGRLPAADLVAEWGRDQVARSFSLAFMLAFPFVLVSVAYNIILGVVNRAMPQLMVALVGAPAISLATLVLLMALTPVIALRWRDAIALVLANPSGVWP